jgi:hypothetical protein
MQYNNTYFKISFDDNYVEINNKLYFLNLNKFLLNGVSTVTCKEGRGVIEHRDKAVVNSEFNSSDAYDHIIDEAILKGSKYSPTETLLKMNEVQNFKPFSVCRGIVKGPEFTNAYRVESRYTSHYLFVIDGRGVEQTTGTIFEKGGFYNVKSLFTTTRKFLISTDEIKWVAFCPEDIARDYNAKMIFKDEQIQTNSYVIPIDGTILVDDVKKEIDELITANSKSLIKLGTASSCMVIEI